MHVRSFFVPLFLAHAISLLAQDSPVPNRSANNSDNPFFSESALPYRLPPFDKIKDDDFVPDADTDPPDIAQLSNEDEIVPDPAPF